MVGTPLEINSTIAKEYSMYMKRITPWSSSRTPGHCDSYNSSTAVGDSSSNRLISGEDAVDDLSLDSDVNESAGDADESDAALVDAAERPVSSLVGNFSNGFADANELLIR